MNRHKAREEKLMITGQSRFWKQSFPDGSYSAIRGPSIIQRINYGPLSVLHVFGNSFYRDEYWKDIRISPINQISKRLNILGSL